MAVEVLALPEIISDPKLRGGRPVIAGTGLRVSDVAALYTFHDYSVAEIAATHDLSLAQVHAALAYYFDHQAEIDQEIRDDDTEIATLREQQRRDGSSLLP